MLHKLTPLAVKSSDDATGEFTGMASGFDILDHDGDIVRKGAFSKSLASGQPIPLCWMHATSDPRNYVGDITQAEETAEGLAMKGKFDLDSEHGVAAYRNTKGRRTSGLSIGYAVRKQVKTAAGNELLDLELIEISVVARGANPQALITSAKAAPARRQELREKVARAQLQAKSEGGPAMCVWLTVSL